MWIIQHVFRAFIEFHNYHLICMLDIILRSSLIGCFFFLTILTSVHGHTNFPSRCNATVFKMSVINVLYMKRVSKLAKDMLCHCCVAETCKTLLVAQLPASVFLCSSRLYCWPVATILSRL
jgi:hypothetical protein